LNAQSMTTRIMRTHTYAPSNPNIDVSSAYRLKWCNRDLIPIPEDRRLWTWQGFAGYWIITGTSFQPFQIILELSWNVVYGIQAILGLQSGGIVGQSGIFRVVSRQFSPPLVCVPSYYARDPSPRPLCSPILTGLHCAFSTASPVLTRLAWDIVIPGRATVESVNSWR
jgi:hypothetical protein